MKCLWCAAVALAVSVPAIAAPPDDSAFRTLDRDGDGYLSKREAIRSLPDVQSFQSADRDGDGRLSMQEFVESALNQPVVAAAGSAEDGAINERVQQLLSREPQLQAVQSSTENRQVFLSGDVETPAQRDEAVRRAMSVDGVRNVADAMTVRQRHD
jgi:Ca2+-binding EF-hand superfamily protein